MELQEVAAAGRSLLNFEESISNELNAELLLGKQINLERARLAALTGDYEELTREINKNIGDFGDFTQMNVLQQESLAKAVGMQADQLADILFKQETNNSGNKTFCNNENESNGGIKLGVKKKIDLSNFDYETIIDSEKIYKQIGI